ncbi:hypothetical protein [Thermodesulfatator autotrophicus]|uniref:Type 4 fimbrial biogenesis protein PilX N-terminal domain-containing protein n=1 Tax=Thermodesulfatator autotrophicus TaxID=1795632 RepID=A0A177E725_9BACT|nr:hypothetical protein [Thermodesulfatator autotrophicus]OAG27695.1 hypothetical protein TH606_05730 [Thermodesulfatator autotrophicus]
MNQKAFAFITTLGIMLVLTIAGTLTTNMIMNRTKSNVITRDSIIALRIAESGAEIILSKFKNGNITCNNNLCSPNSDNKTILGGNYTATLSYDSNTKTVTINSIGHYKTAKREVEVIIKLGKDFYPFAVNGQLTINSFQDTGSGNWTDATMTANSFNIPENDFVSANFTIITKSNLDLPRASDLNISFPDATDCDYGDYSSDQTFTKDFSDQNQDGKIIVCGKNITLDDALIKFNSDLIIAAKGDIEFTQNTTLKRDNTGPTVSLSLISEKEIRLDYNANIDFAGADDGFNLMLYAKEGIISEDTTGQFISISGNQNKTNVSNVFLITPEEILVNRDLIDDTATTRNDVNFLIWADKGISSSNGGFDISGSSDTVRNFSIIVADGNASFDKWSFSGSEDRSGLTYEEIKNYCENGTVLGIPYDFIKIYCDLKNLIDDNKYFQITSWKTY